MGRAHAHKFIIRSVWCACEVGLTTWLLPVGGLFTAQHLVITTDIPGADNGSHFQNAGALPAALDSYTVSLHRPDGGQFSGLTVSGLWKTVSWTHNALQLIQNPLYIMPPNIFFSHGSLKRYVKSWVALALGMPWTFLVSGPDMHHGTCVTHVPWCMPGSLTGVFLRSRWREKRSRHSWRMHNPQFYVSCKRSMVQESGEAMSHTPLKVTGPYDYVSA